jgi:hypothetical protein
MGEVVSCSRMLISRTVLAGHPLRLIRGIVNDVLVVLDGEFARAAPIAERRSICLSGCSAPLCFQHSIDPLRDPAAGAAPLAPLARRARGRRTDVSADDVHEEARPTAAGRGAHKFLAEL